MNTNDYNRCIRTFGAWPLNTCDNLQQSDIYGITLLYNQSSTFQNKPSLYSDLYSFKWIHLLICMTHLQGMCSAVERNGSNNLFNSCTDLERGMLVFEFILFCWGHNVGWTKSQIYFLFFKGMNPQHRWICTQSFENRADLIKAVHKLLHYR